MNHSDRNEWNHRLHVESMIFQIYGMDMINDSFPIFLFVHVLAGSVALIIAPMAMLTVKGGLWHRRWGKIYFWAMAVVAGTAGVMCWIRSGLFLFLVAIFSFYLALTGYTVLRRKRAEDRASALDWGAALVMVIAALVLIGNGILAATTGERWVRLVFGLIGLTLGGNQIRSFVKPPSEARAWFYAHMTRFLAAYIATVTAFSVVNFKFLPYAWRWLWPTILGTAGITAWRRAYARKQLPN